MLRGKGTIEVRTADVERFLGRNQRAAGIGGARSAACRIEPGIAESIAKLEPARITYVSCDPPTLARDLASFMNADTIAQKYIYSICFLRRFIWRLSFGFVGVRGDGWWLRDGRKANPRAPY